MTATVQDVLEQRETWAVEQADALTWLRGLPADSVDLVFGSPPYEQARLYLEQGWVGGDGDCIHSVVPGPVTEKYQVCRCGAALVGKDMGIARKTEEWVSWMVEVYREAVRVCRGLVAFVVEGQTRKYRYSCGPALLMADLHRAGFNLRKPPVFHRVGIPGSGGPDWLRNDHEYVICVTRPGRLPWSDNTAMGHTPKWAPGGEMSHRVSNGSRVNQWGHSVDSGATVVDEGGSVTSEGKRPSHVELTKWGKTSHGGTRNKDGSKDFRERPSHNQRRATSGSKNGDTVNSDGYDPPTLANPGNVIACKVGGGLMGSDLAHLNEAPFPQSLSDFFALSFCPPNGIGADCFAGSGTTLASLVKHGRRAIGCDLRASQVDLTRRRVLSTQPVMM